MSIVLTMSLPYEADISVNRYLGKAPKGKEFTRKTALQWAKVLAGSLNYMLDSGYTPDWLVAEKPFDLDVHVKFPRKFSRRSGDPTNFDKFPRDAIADVLGVDDAGTGGKQSGEYGKGENACIVLTLTLHTVQDTDTQKTFVLWPV